MSTDTALEIITEFKNFEADDGLRAEVQTALSKILELAPYNSCVDATFDREGVAYRWSAEVHSANGPLKVCGVAPSPQEAVEMMETQLLSQLQAWKASRFTGTPRFWHPWLL